MRLHLIGITPTESYVKGDPIPEHKGLITKSTHYRIETACNYSLGYIPTLFLDEDVTPRLMDMFKDKVSLLKNYILKNNLNSGLEVVVEIVDNQVPGLHFDKATRFLS